MKIRDKDFDAFGEQIYGKQICERVRSLPRIKRWSMNNRAKFIQDWDSTTSILRNSAVDLSRIHLVKEKV